MILSRRPDIERFLAAPDRAVRAALIYGRDMGVVRERGMELAGRIAERPDDPFDTAMITDGDLESDPGRLPDELMAISMMVRQLHARERNENDSKLQPAIAKC